MKFVKYLFKVAVSRDFLAFFSMKLTHLWAPDKQAKTYLSAKLF